MSPSTSRASTFTRPVATRAARSFSTPSARTAPRVPEKWYHGFWVMREHEVRQRMESFMKMPAVVAAILLAGLAGLACSSSGLKRSAGDAGVASGGQAGSTISSGTTGGAGGTIGSGGVGGASIGGTAGISGRDAGVDASGQPEPDSSSQRVGAPHPNPCVAGEFLNSGEECYGPPAGESCQSTGDGWCYTQCGQDSTCAGGFVCATIYTFYGSIMPVGYRVCDGPLGAPVGGACRSDKDCNAGASCMTSTHCADASVCPICQN
jgi:hypothetical protein